MIAASSPRHKGVLGYPLPLTLAPYSLKLWVPGHWLRPAGAAQVVRWWCFQSLNILREFSFHYLECWSHWLRSHTTGIYG